MKASVLYSVGDLRYVDIPVPQPKSNGVLVNVKASGICGSDVNRVLKTGTYHFPTVIGHEFSGVVTEIGSHCDEKWLGKRVGVFPLKPCFKCENCKGGNFEMCTNYDYLGSRCNGGFEEYVAVPEWNLIELPDNVSFVEAAMLEPTSVAIHALKQAGDISGKTVTIIGPGMIGNVLCRLAQIRSASQVILVGRTQEKLDFARRYSSVKVVNSHKVDSVQVVTNITGGSGSDIVIEGTGANQSLVNAILMCRSGGKIILMGNPLSDVSLQQKVYWQILRKQLVLSGTWNSSYGSSKSDWAEAIGFISSGILELKPLISHLLQFNQLAEGINIIRDSGVFSNKVMLINDETSR